MRRLLTLAAVALLATGCSDSTGPDIGSIAGTYVLESVNGAPLPYLYRQEGADRYEVLDDVLVIAETASWNEVLHERRTISGTVTTLQFTDEGVYSRIGTGVTLSSTITGQLSTLTASPGALTISGPGGTFVYRRTGG